MSSTISSPVNRLILGDNLEVMKRLEAESVDLIYLDPPFFSNQNYEIIWGDEGKSAVSKTAGQAESTTILLGSKNESN